MREIKFRAWDGETGKMIDLHAITPLALNASMNDQVNAQGMDGLFLPLGGECILMQFTGLRDRNGKEIYEGDILKQYPGFGCEWSPRIGIVKYEGASFWFKFGIQGVVLDDHDCSFIILGNIYQNPGLLNGD